jgi:hypothetical protein
LNTGRLALKLLFMFSLAGILIMIGWTVVYVIQMVTEIIRFINNIKEMLPNAMDTT